MNKLEWLQIVMLLSCMSMRVAEWSKPVEFSARSCSFELSTDFLRIADFPKNLLSLYQPVTCGIR